MIERVDRLLRRLILEKGRFDPDSIEVSFDQPTGDWAAALTRPTINFYLYDIRENLELRSLEWFTKPGKDGKAHKRMAPRRYDLSYLVTVWTQGQVEDEHAVLWRVLAVLANHPQLPTEFYDEVLRTQPLPIRARAAQPSRAIENLPELWGVMENPLRPSINYVVTLAMERDLVLAAPMVLTKRVQIRQRDLGLETAEQILQIGGVVFDADEPTRPVPNAQVTLVESGRSTHTDVFGRYSFANISPGEYHVRIQVNGREVEHRLTIPSEPHDHVHYDLPF